MKRFTAALAAALILLPASMSLAFGGSAHGAGGAQQGGQLPEGHPSTGTERRFVAPGEGEQLLAGEVVETLQSGGYTYIRIKNEGGEQWVAIPTAEVEVGQRMVFAPGDTMYDFESKTLKRKFDVIIFSPGTMYLPGTQMEKTTRDAGKSQKVEKVEKAEGKSAYNVSGIYLKRTILDKKTVSVRGKVVKVSQNIMGKNFVHIQDGSGSAKERNNNLVVTTNDLPEVGDIVTVTGKVAANKDFGYGYKYDVIIEDAKLANK